MSAVLSDRPVEAGRFALGHVNNKSSPVVRAEMLAWPDVVNMLLQHRVGTKDGQGFMPAAIEPGPRHGARVGHVSLLALDVEAHTEALPNGTKRVTGPLPPPLGELAAELEQRGITAVLATSHSHEAPAEGGTLGPRYRVVIQPSRPITAAELRPLGLHLAALLGIAECVDTGCLEPARLYYLPRCPTERQHLAESVEVKGQPLDVDAVLAATAAVAAPPPAPPAASSGAAMRGGSVIEAFNAQADIPMLLDRHGYKPAGRNRWLWPGSTSGVPGVVFLPDKGRVYSGHSADPLHQQGAAHDGFSLWCVLEHGGDTKAAVREAARILGMGGNGVAPNIAPAGWPELDPLPELQDAEPAAFNFDALGPILGPAARAVAEGVQAPDTLAVGSVLASAAVAAQPFADVLTPHGQTTPLSVFIVTSASSGDRKSATDAVAGAPIEAQRRLDARRYARELEAHKADNAARPKRAADTDPPVAHSIVVSKGTTEGLHHLLRTQSHVGLFSTEGAELIGGHSMRDDKKSAGIAWLLKAWGGETLDSMTRGDGLSVLIGRRVSMHVLLQPVIARALISDPLAQGQGWIARCLVSTPRSIAGTRLFRDGAIPPAARPEVRRFHDRLTYLLSLPAATQQGGDGLELSPRHLPMSAVARALWIEFYNESERQQAKGGELEHVRAWASKAAEHAARIAGIVTVIHDPGAPEVSGATMAGAIEVAAFYLAEHVRLMGESQEQQHAARLHALLQFLRERGGRVRHADVLQATPRPVRDLKAEGIALLLTELTQRGYVRRAGDAWEVRP